MHAMSKRHMAIGIARDVDPVRIVELGWVAVGGTDHDMEQLAPVDLPAADLEILAGGADAALGRRLVTEEFLGSEVD